MAPRPARRAVAPRRTPSESPRLLPRPMYARFPRKGGLPDNSIMVSSQTADAGGTGVDCVGGSEAPTFVEGRRHVDPHGTDHRAADLSCRAGRVVRHTLSNPSPRSRPA